VAFKQWYMAVRWVWICCHCGSAKSTEPPSGKPETNWEEKCECEGNCGHTWCPGCAAFLMENEDFYELNRVAGELTKEKKISRVEEHTHLLTAEKAVMKGAGRVKNLMVRGGQELDLTVRDLGRTLTGRPVDHFGLTRKPTVKEITRQTSSPLEITCKGLKRIMTVMRVEKNGSSKKAMEILRRQ